MKLLNTIKDIVCESPKFNPKFNGTVTHDHRNRRVDMSSEAMKWKDKSPTYRQAATMEDVELEEVVEDMEVYHPDFLPEGHHDLDEDLENWSYDGDTIGIEKDLDEYCPMGKPNKCKEVDYDNLPDTLQELVDKNLYNTLDFNKGGEFNEEDSKDCPDGMYYCSEDNICKPDSQKLQEQDDGRFNRDMEGGWGNPIDKSTEKDVPSGSFYSRTDIQKDGKYYMNTLPKDIFFKAVQLLAKSHPETWFQDNSDLGDHPWYRQEEVHKIIKVLGIAQSEETLLDKIFWAASDNFVNIRNDYFDSYDELYLRPYLLVGVPITTTASVYKTMDYTPKIKSYDVKDAEAMVWYDEDGEYEPWDYEGDDTWSEDEHDYEMGDKSQDGEAIVTTLFPAQEGGKAAQTGNRTPSGLTSGDGENDE